ncbi:MAG: hypothetical protein JW748_13405 [Anaerolineales bacterium]|nr:hypothetical protein [Anaerolineales bacterium]
MANGLPQDADRPHTRRPSPKKALRCRFRPLPAVPLQSFLSGLKINSPDEASPGIRKGSFRSNGSVKAATETGDAGFKKLSLFMSIPSVQWLELAVRISDVMAFAEPDRYKPRRIALAAYTNKDNKF